MKSPRGIAANAQGQFIVDDNDDGDVKIFDGRGKFLKSLIPSTDGISVKLDIQNVATDGRGNVYVLIRRELSRRETYAVYLSHESNMTCVTKFALRETGSKVGIWQLTKTATKSWFWEGGVEKSL